MENVAFRIARRIAAEEYDRQAMRDALVASKGVALHAAHALGITENFFWTRAKAVGLDVPGIRAEVGHPKGRYNASARSSAPAA